MASSHRLLPPLATRSVFRHSPHRSALSSALRYGPSSLASPSRKVHIAATPSTSTLEHPLDLTEYTQAIPKLSGAGPFPADVRFEVLGSPHSLLSVSLPASSTLYTRRGTLAGLNGKVENATSTLSMLQPFRRSLLRLPFLYQKITSSSPLTCLVSTNSTVSSFAVVKLDGAVDWIVAQRKAILAWTGESLAIKPRINRQMSFAYMGNSRITGRGLVALVGKGQIFQVILKEGEEYVVHPSNLLAYSNPRIKPKPYRLASNILRFQIPKIPTPTFISENELVKTVSNSTAWRKISGFTSTLRTWSRRTIWGDRLFLKMEGPISILVQSRAPRVSDILSNRDIEDAAAVDKMALPDALEKLDKKITEVEDKIMQPKKEAIGHQTAGHGLTKVAYVRNGKIELEDSDLKEFIKR
ncbi:hypothetical protein BJ508DRAFT_303931 [Ascobolus immersus RN42]|uniref:Altered inheritance of mitochondria protein 24, mitochondrial n=1 Tax=Ascobolus immersus RN42 TaxID=1160509 RepID=A0A3N4IGA1_ASCIM|nr:hypothetical protein BJ508DRAFT_303931 [Ascobolus immersus RN42]